MKRTRFDLQILTVKRFYIKGYAMRFPMVVLLSMCISIAINCIAAVAASVEDFQDFSTDFVPGRLYVPDAEGMPTNLHPLVLFLHGAGESGGNNVSQINGNIDNLLDAAKQRETFLYAPQVQAGSGGWTGSDLTASVMAMIDRAITEQAVDPNRIYVTGLSMGGGGTWNMLNRFPDRFAAGVPIAGVFPAGDFDATHLIDTPIWAFHARNDSVVRAVSSQTIVNRILAAAGEPMLSFPSRSDQTTFEYSNDALQLNYTEWPTGGHGIWGRVYNTAEMYDWMFSQTIAVPEPTTSLLILVGLATAVHRHRHRCLQYKCK